jgi:hypothetical protein
VRGQCWGATMVGEWSVVGYGWFCLYVVLGRTEFFAGCVLCFHSSRMGSLHISSRFRFVGSSGKFKVCYCGYAIHCES